jgi:hypothetical protein
VQGAGLRVWGYEFRVQGAGFRVQGSGFRVQGSGIRVQGSGFRVQGSGFRVSDLHFRAQGLGFWVRCLGTRIYMGGVNHCRSHYRLAKFRGFIHGRKYSAVIGRKRGSFICAQYEFPGACYGFFKPTTALCFPPVHQTTEFR